MDSSFDVPDPSDWLNTPVTQLGTVEAALRCQVCKEFFDTPMITSCSHTFCSLCIRRCITNDGRCPTCRAQEQAMKLRHNAIVQELVDEFQKARPLVLQLGREIQATRDGSRRNTKKRKLDNTDPEDDVELSGHLRRKTRSQNQRRSESHDRDIEHIIDDEKDDDYQPDDGLIACPICSERMKEEAVFSHLDVHNRPETSLKKQLETARPNSFTVPSKTRPPSKPMERLPQLNYSLLKELALRKKLSELGIPNIGPRALMIRRHTEWVNLVNANCDSLRPQTKKELLHELDAWDRTQGRQIVNDSGSAGSASSVMNKDFDGAAWATNHENDFQALIARARNKAKPKTEVGNSSDEGETVVADNHDEDSLPSSGPRNNHQGKSGLTSVSLSDRSSSTQASVVDLEAGG